MKTSITKATRAPSKLLRWADQHNSTTPLLSFLHNSLRILLITLTEFKKNELSLRSSALTYTILLSLVPMLAMSTAIVKGMGGGDQLRAAAVSYIDTLEQNTSEGNPTPASEVTATEGSSSDSPGEKTLTGHLRSAVDQLFDYVDKTNFATLGTVGVVGILLSIILVFSHIESAMNAIWKVVAGRSVMRKIADYLTLLILMPLSINVAFAASAFLANPSFSTKIDKILPFLWLQTLVFKALPVFFIALTFYAIYIFFPNTKVKTFPAIFGSTLAAILWFGIQNLYISLQVGVANYNAIYGSFATLPLFLVWIFLCWMFILTGAQVAYACQHVKSYRLIQSSHVPSQELGAAFDIMDLIYSFFEQNKSVTAQKLFEHIPQYPQVVIEETVSKLKESKLIHTSQTDKRLLPTSPAQQFDNREIIKLVLGTEAPDTSGGKKSLEAIETITNSSPGNADNNSAAPA